MPHFAAGRPDDQHEAPCKKAVGLESRLTIIKTVILQREYWSVEQFRRIGEIQTALVERRLALPRIETDLHQFTWTQ